MRRRDGGFRVGRRRFLGVMGGGAAAALGAGGLLLPALQARALDSLTPFVDPLPIPAGIQPTGTFHGLPRFNVAMKPFKQKLHRDLPPTRLWGYSRQYPGPTFEARRGSPIAVQWRNELPTSHMFPIDNTLHGDESDQPQVRTVVHLHGARVLPESDGYPEAWFTRNFEKTGPFFQNRTYVYPNDQAAATLWYHDHALGTTRLNVYAGLAGFFLIRDSVEDALNLPKGAYEIPLMIQDRLFNPDGSLLYPVIDTGGDPDPRVPPVWIPELFGDTVLVNGKVWPFLEVEPRKYRFRILNASNARFYHVTLEESQADGTPLGILGPKFIQIGTDGGFLPAPVVMQDLTMGIAERFDVIIDFSGAFGKYFLMKNDANAPFPDGDDIVPANVMLFKVTKPLGAPDTSSVPPRLAPVPLLGDKASEKQVVRTRDLVLSEVDSPDPFGNPIVGLINAPWADPVTEDPKAGTVEIWRIINFTEDAHPIHIHLVQFQIIDRQLFEGRESQPSRLIFTSPPVPPPPNERPAFKDTVKVLPEEIVRVIARFDLPTGAQPKPGERFRYVLHCHVLEHEDNDMMRPYDVVG